MEPEPSPALRWTTHYRNDPDYRAVRFKRLAKGYPPFDFVPAWIDVVSPEEFFTEEPGRLPFFLGTQFGLHPVQPTPPDVGPYLRGAMLVATLGKSLLSGAVSGLKIRRVSWLNQPRANWKVLQEIRDFPNL